MKKIKTIHHKCYLFTFEEALDALNENEIELAFLDILLDKNTSFDCIDHSNFQIIFTTAFNTVDYFMFIEE